MADLAQLLDALAAARAFPALKEAFVVLAPASPVLTVLQGLEAFASGARDLARRHMRLFVEAVPFGAAASAAAEEDPLRDPAHARALADVLAARLLAACPTDYERRNLLALLAQAEYAGGEGPWRALAATVVAR